MGTVSKRESLGTQQLEDLVALALEEARRLGVDQAEAAASDDTGLSATARLGEVENLEYTNDRGIGITVFKDSRKGNASTSDLSPTAIRETVAKAVSFASFTAEDKYSGLADADLMCREIHDLDLDHPWALDADTAIAMAIESEAAGLGCDDRISNSEGATVATNRGTRAYGNTHGFIGSYSKTSHSVTCVLLAEEGGVMQRDYHYTAARCADDMEAGVEVGRRAGEKTVARLGARKIETTRAPVLYVPELARGFVGHAIGAIAGGAQYRKASFLLDAVGETLFPEFVSIHERPHLPRGITTCAYEPSVELLPQDVCDTLRDIPDFERVGAGFISHEAEDLSRPRVAALVKMRRNGWGELMALWGALAMTGCIRSTADIPGDSEDLVRARAHRPRRGAGDRHGAFRRQP